MVLSLGLTTQEIRVLQEFRRLGKDALSSAEIQAIKHPVTAAEKPEMSLLSKGYLTAGEAESFSLTPRADPLLAYNPVPENEPVVEAESPAAETTAETTAGE
ncbi:MAG TPA: hypothetical protein VNM92_04440 [Thermoanaerobaculia bacterium]|nr:hypothetical protein [Thermoanaerobaculia bacterium]